MDMKIVAIAAGVFFALVAGFLGFVIWYGSSDVPASAPGAAQTPASGQSTSALEQQVLQGYEVQFWGDGRPFVRYYDPGAGEHATQSIEQALFWQAQYAGGDFSETDFGTTPANPAGVEAAYRLGLVYEHGLFHTRVDKGEAMRNYRIAKMGGHPQAAAAEKRLQAAGVK
ncbi:MAG: hypothetical protein H6841_05825 [Planctomycetes bacterium]|nr:hypothetical protein [Planctomycetota bacterium]MCB9934326.1 hypothetical protein [Planctomycetota bacterium]